VRAQVHLRLGDGEDSGLSADFALPGCLEPADIDVGDVAVAAPPVVLSGTVRDAAGAPLDRAVVDIAKLRGTEEPTEAPPYEWVAGARAMTDRQGRFTVSGRLPAGEYAAEARAKGYVGSGLLPIAVGARGFDFSIESQGALSGLVLLAEGVDPESILVEVTEPRAEPVGVTSSPGNSGSLRIQPDGTFRRTGLRPGLVDVCLRIRGEKDALATIEAVSIPAGGDSTDPRLRPIDLRELVQRQIEVRLVGPDNGPVASAAVAIRPSGDGAAPARRILCEDGQLTIASRSRALDLEVDGRGMRVARRDSVTGKLTIVLEPGSTVAVRVEDTDAGTVFQLTPDPTALTGALKALADQSGR
jgi:hypothetical protein